MSHLLDSIHDNCVHKFNPIVADGVSVAQMEDSLEYVDRAFKMSSKTFPEGLEYLGYEKATVEEEYKLLTLKRAQQHNLELARSDTFLVNYLFAWKGKKLAPRPVYFPFVSQAGLMYLRGKRFTVLPVLADETLSVSKGDIYVPFLAAKITFKRKQYWLLQDGIQTSQYLVYSKIHNHKVSSQPRRGMRASTAINCLHTMAHYLFCKYGVVETFRKFYNGNVFITDQPIDREVFPEETYSVFESVGEKPRSVRAKDWVKNPLKIVIAKKELNNGVLGLLCGFFYVLDHYTDRIHLDYLDGSEAEIRMWRQILGHAIYKNNDSLGNLLNRADEHFESLDNYLDDLTREGLEAEGYECQDIYELFALLIYKFTDIIMSVEPASMYGKMLAVNRYVLADLIKAVSLLKFKLIGIKKREVTEADVNKCLSKFLKPEVIINGFKNHNEVTTIQCPGDNIMFNYTSRLILQENATGASRKRGTILFKDPSRFLHSSIAAAGSILALPKAEPTGKVVLNPCLPMTRNWKITKPKRLEKELDYIQSQIARE